MGLTRYKSMAEILTVPAYKRKDGVYLASEVDALLTPTPGTGLPEGCPKTIWVSPGKRAAILWGHGDEPVNPNMSQYAVRVEIHPVGTAARLASLPTAPREWRNSEEFKTAPPGPYTCHGHLATGSLVKKKYAANWLDEDYPNRFVYGPIPQPETKQ